MLSNAELILKDDKVSMHTASDYSYHSDSYAGPHYRIVGDAGGECHTCQSAELGED